MKNDSVVRVLLLAAAMLSMVAVAQALFSRTPERVAGQATGAAVGQETPEAIAQAQALHAARLVSQFPPPAHAHWSVLFSPPPR